MDKTTQDPTNTNVQDNSNLIRDIHYEFINEELLEDMSYEEKLAQLTTFDEKTENEILEDSHCKLDNDYYRLNEITKDLTNQKLRASDLKAMNQKERKHAHIETNKYALTRKSSKSTIDERFDKLHDDNHHRVLFTVIALLIIALTIATKTPYLLILLVVLLAYKMFLISKTKKRQNNVK